MNPENVLGKDERPRFFRVDDPAAAGLAPPEPRHGVTLRTYTRSLAGMQKEALVTSSGTDAAWRLVSDEGPYLAGHDEAPFPLAFLSAGMVASYFGEIAALASRRGVGLDDLRLVLDSRYTMEGSALRGTMLGGALPPELHVTATGDASGADLAGLCADAVRASPLHGLLQGQHTSRFTLTSNGRTLPVGKVATLDVPRPGDPAGSFDALTVAGPADAAELMRRSAPAELHEGEGGTGSSLQADQKRTLHVRAICTARPDGVKAIEINLFKPSGSSFHLLSDELAGRQAGRAPDAATLVAAGIGFCFLTQLGRYAAITKKQLDGYRTVQDTHFSLRRAAGDPAPAGRVDPVETHVYVDTPEGDDYARTLVDMGEQTCFLHALCRTALETRLTVGAAA